MKSPFRFALALLALFAIAPTQALPVVSTPRLVDMGGNVMYSRQNAPFSSVDRGMELQPGDRLMLGESSFADVQYAPDEIWQLRDPGIFNVPTAFPGPYVGGGNVGSAGGASVGGTAGVIGGAAVIGAIATQNTGDNKPPVLPVSP